MKNDKQYHIMKYLSTVPQASVKKIYENVPFGYYANGHKHLGEILARMVKNRKIERVRKGIYRYVNATEFVKILASEKNNLFSDLP